MNSQKLIGLLFLALCLPLTNSTLGAIQPIQMKMGAPTETPVALPTQTAPERPMHFSMSDPSLQADYSYRSFLQVPLGMAWGPDNQLYVADYLGRHIVRITPKGEMSELNLISNPWKDDGPRTLAFSPDGTLYVNDHSHIYRIDQSNQAQPITGVSGNPIGGIAISPDGELFYTDRSSSGAVRHWNKNGTSNTIVENLPFVENMVFAPDGALYVSERNMGKVYKVDVKTHAMSLFYSMEISDSIYLAVDHEGDIWIRGINFLIQLSPKGQIKPFLVDGKSNYGDPKFYMIATSSGLAFDKEGGLWLGSYDSRLIKFSPTKPGAKDPAFKSKTISTGLVISSMAVSQQGDIYATDSQRHEVIRIKSGKIESLGNFGCAGNAAIALDRNDKIYVGLPCGKIMTMDQKGHFSNYASLTTDRMTFGADGGLYAIVSGSNNQKSLVRITGKNKYIKLTESIAGLPLGAGEVHIASWKEGLYIFVESGRYLFRTDFEGKGELINIQPTMAGAGPAPITATSDGRVFIIPHGPYDLLFIDAEGSSKVYASGFYGDPWALAVSPDGQWLYVAECGAIDRLEIKKLAQ